LSHPAHCATLASQVHEMGRGHSEPMNPATVDKCFLGSFCLFAMASPLP
jgi:hypothetical protein